MSGFALGLNPSAPGFSAYTIVLIDLTDPSKTAAYFQLNRTSLSLLIQSFVSVDFPDWMGNFISVDSLVVNYNPSAITPGSKGPPTTTAQNSVVAKSSADCNNAMALTRFDPPIPGVSHCPFLFCSIFSYFFKILINVTNLRIANGLIVIQKGVVFVSGAGMEMALQINKFTAIPGTSQVCCCFC